MTEKYSRAQRRYDRARIMIKRQFHWGYGHKESWRNWGKIDGRGIIEFMPPEVAGSVARTSKPCSCWMCRNPRHNGCSDFGKLTLQERKALDNFNSQLEEVDSEQEES